MALTTRQCPPPGHKSSQRTDSAYFSLAKYFLLELKIPKRKYLESRRQQIINTLCKVLGVRGRAYK